MKEKQAPSQSGLAAAALSKRSSRGMAAGNHSASEPPVTLPPLVLLWPPDPEGCICNLKFTDILPGRRDNSWFRGAAQPSGLPTHSGLQLGLRVCFCSQFLVGLAWCCLPLPSTCWCSPTIISAGNPLLSDCMCESSTAPAMPVPTSC